VVVRPTASVSVAGQVLQQYRFGRGLYSAPTT
jgi:hypothetical protein